MDVVVQFKYDCVLWEVAGFCILCGHEPSAIYVVATTSASSAVCIFLAMFGNLRGSFLTVGINQLFALFEFCVN
jgi:hypothetical protein